MKKLAALLIAFTLAACGESEIAYDPLLHQGTDRGVRACMDEEKLSGRSETDRKNICVREHQKPLVLRIGGRGNYVNHAGAAGFSGYLKNLSTSQIITSFEIKIHHNEMVEGEFDVRRLDNLWILPGQQHDFIILPGELTFQPSPSSLALPGSLPYAWDMTNIKGVIKITQN